MARSKKPVRREEVLLSLERTLLSKERTVLSEITVLLGTVALGFLVIRLFQGTEFSWLVWVGFAMVVGCALGTAYAIAAFRKYSRELGKVEHANDIHIK